MKIKCEVEIDQSEPRDIETVLCVEPCENDKWVKFVSKDFEFALRREDLARISQFFKPTGEP